MSEYVDLETLINIEVLDLDNEETTVGKLIRKLNRDDRLDLSVLLRNMEEEEAKND